MVETVSLAMQTLARYSGEHRWSVGGIAVRLFGRDTVLNRRRVHSLIDQARAAAAKAH